jgi:Fic family protein
VPSQRTYLRTHPWLRFAASFREAKPLLWILLGEARSKCLHIAGAPLPPASAKLLHRLYLAKGVLGTTAIEGNTLTLDQVEQHLEGKLKLPPSQQYLQDEIANILTACNFITTAKFHKEHPKITPELLRFFNTTVLSGLELGEGVVAGRIRTHSVGVARYLGAPAEDCEYLLERLCEWLDSADFSLDPDLGLAVPILKAILAHLYIAWIHPFGDGNGRTARLVEFNILVDAGVPKPAAHLLSNHYNLTRAVYYRELDKASRSGGDVTPFVLYALQGFVDQLREQINVIQGYQLIIAWRDYVNEGFEGKKTPSDWRRKRLLLLISWRPAPMRRRDMIQDPLIAKEYLGKTMKTLTRDLNTLMAENLVERTPVGFRARTERIFAFLPTRRGQDQVSQDDQLVLPISGSK